MELTLKIIKEKNLPLLGYKYRLLFFRLAKDLTDRIRKQSGSMIVWGGIHPTICPQPCIEIADAICIGEGEDVILELSRNLRDRKSINNIRNLWIRDDKVHQNPLRPLIQNLDSIPFPYIGDKNTYFIEENRILPPSLRRFFWSRYRTTASRGCLFSCTYCCNSILKNIYKDKRRTVLFLRRI